MPGSMAKKFLAKCKKLICGCASLQSKEETASPAPRLVVSAPIPHFDEWVQDPLEQSRWHPAWGKWIHDGIHEPYQEKRKFGTHGEPFVPKRLPIPRWQLLPEGQNRFGQSFRFGEFGDASPVESSVASPPPPVSSAGGESRPPLPVLDPEAAEQRWIDAGMPQTWTAEDEAYWGLPVLSEEYLSELCWAGKPCTRAELYGYV
ncbi:MAG: hypothetical protein Q9171_007355 [Xanthocarpia ochracea]